MPQPEPHRIDQLQQYLPRCRQCGVTMILARIEPAPEDGHDRRTFECDLCDLSEIVMVKFR